MEGRTTPPPVRGFRHFFVRGLAILLPTVLTIWILIAAYQFVQVRIASPINQGVKRLVVDATPFPTVSEVEISNLRRDITETRGERYRAWRTAGETQSWLEREARRSKLQNWWGRYSLVLDLIGLVLAIVLIYIVGVLLGSYIGRRLYNRGEQVLNRVPLIRRVYPSVKQVTDFFVGDNKNRPTFSRVVAAEYPRKGTWSVGLVTGETMRDIQERAGEDCLTVFIPSSPTPFTGYVITVPRRDTIELPISVEDAMKFAVSGGVLIPPAQQIEPAETASVLPHTGSTAA